jgi:two-component system C4-dicarboxylate transport response regulator DctD
MSAEGRFRLDLYYRLSVVELVVPPLRERIEDVPLLFEYFATSAAAAHERQLRPIIPATMSQLMAHSWPGNVRELRNAAERYALGLREPLLAPQDVFAGQRLSLAQQVESFERALIGRCLVESGGRISAVMEMLAIPRRTRSEKRPRLGLDRRRFTSTAGPNAANESAPIGGKLPIR